MQNHKSLRLILVMLFAALGVGFTISPAQAAGSCDAVVNDGAGVFHGSDTSKVTQAAQSLVSSVNADVRVVTAKSLGSYATLDDFVQGIQSSCPSWQSPNGGRKSNLLVFAMTLNDHKLGIFYGDEWTNAFTGPNSESNIYTTYMVPKFKGGDFAGGFVDGMKASQQVLTNYLHPGSANTAITSGGSSGKSNAGLIVGIIFGGLFVLVLIGLAIWLVRKRNEENEAKRLARQEALRFRDAASTILQQLGDSNSTQAVVRKAKVAKYSQVSDDLRERLATAAATVNQKYTMATNGMQSAASASATANDEDLTTSEYQELAKRYQAVLKDAQAAQAASDQIDDIAQEVDDKQRHAAEMLAQLQQRHAALDTALNQLVAEGITPVDVQAAFDEATEHLTAASQHMADFAVLQDLDQAEQSLKSGETALQTLNQQRAQLKSGLPALEQRIEQVKSQLDPTRQCFDRISGTYVRSCWQSVEDNGSAATQRIESAKASLEAATTAANVTNQQWAAAIDNMQKGNHHLDEAETLLAAVTKLETDLAAAKAEAPGKVEAAKAAISEAGDYIDAHRADVHPSHRNHLADASDLVSQASTALQADKPDYLAAVKLALDAGERAHFVLEKATQEYQAAERLRQQAQTALSDASHAIDKAQDYIRDHSGDVKNAAREKLRSAEATLRGAQDNHDPAVVLREATQAKQLADDTYSKARKNHRDAEEEREEEERRRRSYSSSGSGFGSGVGVGYVFGSESSSSSFGGGSSGGFGGGSSGSFGGGSDGGGSSGSW